MTQLRAGRRGGAPGGEAGRALPAFRSRAAGSGARSEVFTMGTTLDIKIKRANKVYHTGVSGGSGVGLQVLWSPRVWHTSEFPWAGASGSGGSSQVHPPPGAAPSRCISLARLAALQRCPLGLPPRWEGVQGPWAAARNRLAPWTSSPAGVLSCDFALRSEELNHQIILFSLVRGMQRSRAIKAAVTLEAEIHSVGRTKVTRFSGFEDGRNCILKCKLKKNLNGAMNKFCAIAS